MAKTEKSYRIDKKKKVVVLFSNIKQTDADKMLIDTYVRNGYTLKAEIKITVAMMRAEMKNDKTALDEFNRLYTLNEEGGALGFHRACQFYTKWKKENKK